MKKVVFSFVSILSLSMLLVGCSTKEKADNEKDDTYTVTMVLAGSQQDDEERIEGKINEILEPALNAKLDLIVLPFGSAVQQRQLMLSGNEKIDTFYIGLNDAVNFMNAGQIVDMSDLVKKHGKNINEIFEEEELSANTINDFTLGVPAQIERGDIPAVYLRKDLVEKYKIDLTKIKKPADLEEIYATVKAGEPEMDMLYSSGTDNTPIDRLQRVDDIGGGLGVLMDPVNSTKVENLFASDWYMETTKTIYEFYQNGYINKDAATNSEDWRTLLKNGNLFSVFYTYHPATPTEFKTSTGYDFEIVKFEENALKKSTAYGSVMFSIAQNSENPEKTMQVLDYIYGSASVMNLLNWGEEGTDYVLTDKENGLINYPEGKDIDTVGYSLNLGWELPNQFIAHLWEGSDPNQWNNMKVFNDEAEVSQALGFLFDRSGYETTIAALDNVTKQYQGTINSGTVDPEKYIPEFLDALEKAGVQEIIDAKQEQLDEWLKTK